MAQGVLKHLSARNAGILNRMHQISLAVHGFFLILSWFFFKRSYLAWFLLSLPAFIIEFWFERISRPKYTGEGKYQSLKSAGEDLEAKGLTEWMWDVVYWTWGCVGLAAIAGDWVWYAYAVVPAYSAWLAYTTFTGAKAGLSGMASGAGEGASAGGQSKRQAKMEKRGGQKVQYR